MVEDVTVKEITLLFYYKKGNLSELCLDYSDNLPSEDLDLKSLREYCEKRMKESKGGL